MAEISTALVSEGDSKEQNEATKMSAEVLVLDRLLYNVLITSTSCLVYAWLAQYLVVAKNLATAKLCSSPH